MVLVDNRLEKLINDFPDYLDYFKKNNPFSGPSKYFYRRIIRQVNSDAVYSTIFTSEFIELLYATLAAWGMHRPGPKGPKMNDFEKFKNCLLNQKERFIELSGLKLSRLPQLDKNLIAKTDELYLSLAPLMSSSSKFVASTKMMHFLLPHLIPPMDREYTLKFFKRHLPSGSLDNKERAEKELETFNYILGKMHSLAQQADAEDFTDDYFSPTAPKVLDNAIVGYIRKEFPPEKNKQKKD